MDSILMRTMTYKSILGFGYSSVRDLSVGQLIDLKNYRVLISSYYGLDKINFIDDVLDDLGITEDMRIPKPGKLDNDGKGDMVYKALGNIYSNYSDNKKMGLWSKGEKQKRLRKKRKEKYIKHKSSKFLLQSKNQGH